MWAIGSEINYFEVILAITLIYYIQNIENGLLSCDIGILLIN